MSDLRAAAERALRCTEPSALLDEPIPMTGGRSGITLASVLTTDAGRRPVVLKATPSGRAPAGRHDVLRQADILDALAGRAEVPCPRVLARVTDEPNCIVMERCPGEAVEPVLDAGERVLPAALVRERAARAARILAALHRAEPAALPVTAAERPAPLRIELERWSATAAAVDPALAPGIETLAERLRVTVPDDVDPVLVHGDFRLGNVVFDGVEPKGVIDWEIWSVTHPGVDLGWFLVFCDADAFPGIGRPVLGLPSADDLLDVYLAAGGAALENVAWFDAFGRFKMAAIMAHNLKRHRTGRHVDPYQERLPPTISRLVESGTERLRRVRNP